MNGVDQVGFVDGRIFGVADCGEGELGFDRIGVEGKGVDFGVLYIDVTFIRKNHTIRRRRLDEG